MKLKKLKKIKINTVVFDIKWDKKSHDGSFLFGTDVAEIEIGCAGTDVEAFNILCHEIFEIVAIMNWVRYRRPDCESDYLFSYDHRQHAAMMDIFAGIISEFIA